MNILFIQTSAKTIINLLDYSFEINFIKESDLKFFKNNKILKHKQNSITICKNDFDIQYDKIFFILEEQKIKFLNYSNTNITLLNFFIENLSLNFINKGIENNVSFLGTYYFLKIKNNKKSTINSEFSKTYFYSYSNFESDINSLDIEEKNTTLFSIEKTKNIQIFIEN